MLEERVEPSPWRQGGHYYTYEYSVVYLHRTIGLYNLLQGKKGFWLLLPQNWPGLKKINAMLRKICSAEKQLLNI